MGTEEFPRRELYAIVGVPGSGKSTVQDILHENHAIAAFDDGHLIRSTCHDLFGFSWEDMTTQEGKRKIVTIDGITKPIRWFLGEMGDAWEIKYGPNVIPQWAVRTALALYHHGAGFSFGSVRRQQLAYYLAHGGSVLEVYRPGQQTTGNVWDLYDPDLVTCRIVNDDTLEVLGAKVAEALPYLRENVGRTPRPLIQF